MLIKNARKALFSSDTLKNRLKKENGISDRSSESEHTFDKLTQAE